MRILASIMICVSILFAGWSSEPGSPIALGSGTQPQIASRADGGAYIAWLSGADFHIYMQNLDPAGNILWERNGRLISSQPNESWIAFFHLNLLCDMDGNAIITSVDSRSGNWEVYAYKLNPEGEHLWTADGLQLSNSGQPNISPRMTLNPVDNSIIVHWADNYSSVRLQRIAAAGTLLWGDAGISISANDGNLMSPQSLITDSGNLLVQWIKQIGNFPAISSQVVVQEFGLDGQELWPPRPLAAAEGFPMGNWQQDLVRDGLGGSYSSWTVLSGNSQAGKVQRVTGTGNLSWFGSVDVSTESSHFRVSPRIAKVPGSEDLFAIWNESDGDQFNRGIMAQRISGSGLREWGNTGIAIEPMGAGVFMDLQISAADMDLLACYTKESAGVSNIYGTRLDGDGNTVWGNSPINLTNSGVSKSDLVLNAGFGCTYLAWSESDGIYAHCLLDNGSLGAPLVDIPGIIHVPADFASIQAAIEASSVGDTILVQNGTYYENVNFLGKDIILGSLFMTSADTAHISETIIDGGGNGSCIVMENHESTVAQVIGLTLENGSGYFADPDGDGDSSNYGGGIYLNGASPRLRNLLVVDNSVSGGGGGGLFCYASSPILEEIEFRHNISDDVGGAIYARSFSDLQISHSKFLLNECTDVGGALYARDSSDVKIERSLIHLNSSLHAGAGLGFKNGCKPLLDHLTITDNSAAHFGGSIYSNSSYVRVVNSILWGNEGGEIHFPIFDDPSELLVAFSDVQGGAAGITTNDNGTVIWEEHSLDGDPMLLGFLDDLGYNSPCRDAGTLFFEFEGDVLVDHVGDEFMGAAPDMGSVEVEHLIIEYLPLQLDRQWTYTSVIDTLRITVIDSSEMDGENGFVIDGWYPMEDWVNPIVIRDNGAWVLGDSEALLLFEFSASVGETWTINPGNEFVSTMTLVNINEVITTPLGTFENCVQFYREVGSDYAFNEWFAPDVGLVQRDNITLLGPLRYQLVSVGEAVSIDPVQEIPRQLTLYQNYPNPFNPETRISYDVPLAGPVSLIIYDQRGGVVRELVDDYQGWGSHAVLWDGTNRNGSPVSSGVYFYQLYTQSEVVTRKMILLK